jgi:hypothetical protein
MGFFIEDGQGSGIAAGVNNNNRLRTSATTYTSLQSHTIQGDAYNVNVGILTLTSSLESAITYIKNTSGVSNLQFDRLYMSLGNYTSGSGDVVVRFYQNVSAGTIINYAQSVTASSNRNFGVSKPIPATTYKGGDGNTATGGSQISTYILQHANFYTFSPEFVVTPGTSFVITVQPKTGNTNIPVNATLNLFEVTEEAV